MTGTAGSKPYAKDLDRPCRGGVEVPPLDELRPAEPLAPSAAASRRGVMLGVAPAEASGDGGMMRKDSRTDHCSLTPLVPKSGVAPEGMARAKPRRAVSRVISWCSACKRRVIWRMRGAGIVEMDVSTSSCVSSRADTCGEHDMLSICTLRKGERGPHPQNTSLSAVQQD